MKIALSSQGNQQSSLLSHRFGRCAYFAFYDDETGEWSFAENKAAQETSGAGIQAAQHIVDSGAEILLTGEVGPKAWQVIDASPLEVFAVPEIPLPEAISIYREGRAQKMGNNMEGAANTSNDADESRSLSESKENTAEPAKEEADGANNDEDFSSHILAIATDHNQVAQHFGRCQGYTLVRHNRQTVTAKEFISNPGHEPGFLPRFLAEKGIHCIVAGGMGPRAQRLFDEHSIDYIIGVSGSVDEAANSFLKGELSEGESSCQHDAPGHHGCS